MEYSAAGYARTLPKRTTIGVALPFCGASAVVLCAPFEALRPWVVTPWQTLTNLETVTIGALLLWLAGCWLAGSWPQWRTPLTSPWLILLAILLVSALSAPAFSGNALRLVGRLSVALAVFLLTVNVTTSASRLRQLATMAMLAGTLVGAVAILEQAQVHAVLEWLKAFRPGLNVIGGELRASSTIQYPTITSMYLEIVFALGLGLLLVEVDRRRTGGIALAFAGLVLVAEGIVLTFTRMGTLTVGTSLAVVAAFRYARCGFDRGIVALAALAILIATLAVLSRSDETLWLRLTTESRANWYRAEYRVPERLNLTTGDIRDVEVTVTNTGRVTWYPDRDPPFRLGYHWLADAGNRVVEYDGLRTEFPAEVPPGAPVALQAHIQAPFRPGRYRLAWDVVIEHRLWFSTEDSPSAYTDVIVTGASVTGERRTTPLPTRAVRLGRLALWRVAARMFVAHPLLGVGPDNFRLLYGAYAGLSGTDSRIHTNNMYLEILVGGGLAGGAAFLWLLWRVATTLGATARRIDNEYRFGFAAVAAAVVAILVHGLADSFRTFTPTYLMISVTLGLLVACALPRRIEPDADRI